MRTFIPLTVSLKHLLAYFILSILLVVSCRRAVNLPDTLDAHYISYKIEYLEDKAGDIPTRILPRQMDAYYTKYYALSRIEGFFNQFLLIQIADLKRKQVTTLLNFFGKKFYYVGDNGELPASIVAPEKMSCKFTGETKMIGGLNSEKVDVDTGEEQFSIYCTKDFSVRRPNITTPYRTIDYPLSEFRIQLSVLKMHLSTVKYELKTIDSEIFTVPEEYSRVSRESMEDIINSLFTKE